MNNGYTVPVTVFIFNRPALAEKIVHILEQVRPEKVFVISDGAREHVPGEKEKVERARAVFDQLSWPCEIYRNYAEKNMGCDDRIPSGITWVFEQVEQAVLLEDDCMPDPQFFLYAEEMLKKYQEDPQVMMIAGSNFMQRYENGYCCTFTSRTYSWGWATWKRAWEHYCDGPEEWERIQKDGTLAKVYPLRSRYYVKKELNYYFKRGKCPWDYLWWISCMGVGGLCAVPCVNLVTNEGFGEDATHTVDKGDYSGETFEMKFPLHFPESVERDRKIDRFDRGLNPAWKIVRAYRKILRLVKHGK